MKRVEAATQARGDAVHSAFGDLDALMGNAKQMVGLASRLKAVERGTAGEGGEDAEVNDMRRILFN